MADSVNAPAHNLVQPVRRAAIAPAPLMDKRQARIGARLAPQIITDILRRADEGYMDRIADLLDEVRETDPHLHSVLFKREAQVAGAEWEIRPAKKARGIKKRDKVVEFCTDVLDNLQSFSQVIAHLQSAVYHGRAAAEIIWARDGSKWVPGSIEPIHPRRLSYSADWRLHLWDATAGTDSSFAKFPGVPVDALPKGKFIVHMPRVRGGYPTREGLGRILVWYSVFKRWTQRDWMSLAEMVGRPGRVGYYNTGTDPTKPAATEEDQNILDNALRDWSSSQSVVLPDTTKIEFQFASGPVGEMHKMLVEHCNGEMSKATLGETLTTDAGSRGARSLGTVHDDVRIMVAKWDARAISETLRYHLLAPLVRLNFGESTPVPEIAFEVEPEDNLNELADRIQKLVFAGLDIPQGWVRDRFGIDDPTDGEDTLAPAAGPGGGAIADPDAKGSDESPKAPGKGGKGAGTKGGSKSAPRAEDAPDGSKL